MERDDGRHLAVPGEQHVVDVRDDLVGRLHIEDHLVELGDLLHVRHEALVNGLHRST